MTVRRLWLNVAACAALMLAPLAASAGDVTVTVSGGTLKVAGSPDGDELEIAGMGPNDINVTPNVGTTVNGNTSVQTFMGAVKGLKIDLDDGADDLSITTIERPNVAVKTGAGPDQVFFLDTTFTAKASIDLGADNNALSLCSSVLPKVTIKAGAPNGTQMFADCPMNVPFGLASDRGSPILIGDSFITGKVSVKTGQGLDVVGVVSVDVEGDVKIAMGADSASVGLCDTAIAGNLTIGTGKPVSGIIADFLCETADAQGEVAVAFEDLTVDGKLKLKTGATSDDVVFLGFSVDGKASLDAGAGINSFDLINGEFGADMSAKSGAGPDTYLLDTLDVIGNAKLSLGAGGNVLSSKDVFVEENLSIKAGKDDDIINTVGISVGGTSKVDGGGGMDTIN